MPIHSNNSASSGGSGGTSDHSQLTNRSSANQHPISAITNLQTTLDSKVDEETGKGLSTNDYTTSEKNKLSGIEAGAQVNPDLSSYATQEYVNEAIEDIELIQGPKGDKGDKGDVGPAGPNTVTTSTTTNLTGILKGNGSNIAQAQAGTDYSTFSGSYTDLSNKPSIPTKTSDLSNDSGFITDSSLEGLATEEYVSGALASKQDASSYLDSIDQDLSTTDKVRFAEASCASLNVDNIITASSFNISNIESSTFELFKDDTEQTVSIPLLVGSTTSENQNDFPQELIGVKGFLGILNDAGEIPALVLASDDFQQSGIIAFVADESNLMFGNSILLTTDGEPYINMVNNNIVDSSATITFKTDDYIDFSKEIRSQNILIGTPTNHITLENQQFFITTEDGSLEFNLPALNCVNSSLLQGVIGFKNAIVSVSRAGSTDTKGFILVEIDENNVIVGSTTLYHNQQYNRLIIDNNLEVFGDILLDGTVNGVDVDQLSSDFSNHASDTSIHFKQEDISITASQVSDFAEATEKLKAFIYLANNQSTNLADGNWIALDTKVGSSEITLASDGRVTLPKGKYYDILFGVWPTFSGATGVDTVRLADASTSYISIICRPVSSTNNGISSNVASAHIDLTSASNDLVIGLKTVNPTALTGYASGYTYLIIKEL